jgi:hypothetical protein
MLIIATGINLNFFPIALHIHSHTQIAQHFTQIIAQLFDKPLTYWLAFNDDFGKNFDDKMHDGLRETD